MRTRWAPGLPLHVHSNVRGKGGRACMWACEHEGVCSAGGWHSTSISQAQQQKARRWVHSTAQAYKRGPAIGCAEILRALAMINVCNEIAYMFSEPTS